MSGPSKSFEHYFTIQQRSKPSFGLVRTYLRGKPFEFMTASGVFSRKQVDLGTRLLIESMVLPKKGNILDIGCGYGAIGIAAAVLNSRLHVFMVDVNIRAVRLARQNIEMNNVENAVVRRGNFYQPFEELFFDCVLSNPPVSAGMETVKAMISEAPEHMTKEASFQMVVRSKIAGKRLCTIFEEAFENIKVSARGSGYRVLMSEKH
jgi:16S rRNA (guanine1207-N2)-methyltransferase